MGICFLNEILVSGIPISYSYVSTKFLYSNSLPYQLLLSAQTTSYRYSFQLFLSATPSYSYQLLLSAARNRKSLLLVTVSATPYSGTLIINQSFQLLFSGTAIRYHCHILLSATRINHSFQVLLSVICIYSTRILL